MAQEKNHIGETNKMVEHQIVDTNKMMTAVEWLIQEIRKDVFVHSKSTKEWNEIFKQAKAMEKEQIMKAWDRAYTIGGANGSNDWVYECELTDNSEYYYNETYKK